MGTWTDDELRSIDAASELRVSSQRPDGHPPSGSDHLAHHPRRLPLHPLGPWAGNGWFRRARQAGVGRINSGGIEKDVTFTLADPDIRAALDAALHKKYDRYGSGPVAAITGDDVLQTTLKVTPTD